MNELEYIHNEDGWWIESRLASPDGKKMLLFKEVTEFRMCAYGSLLAMQCADMVIDFPGIHTFGAGVDAQWSPDSDFFATPILKDSIAFLVYDVRNEKVACVDSDNNHYKCQITESSFLIEDRGEMELISLDWQPYREFYTLLKQKQDADEQRRREYEQKRHERELDEQKQKKERDIYRHAIFKGAFLCTFISVVFILLFWGYFWLKHIPITPIGILLCMGLCIICFWFLLNVFVPKNDKGKTEKETQRKE